MNARTYAHARYYNNIKELHKSYKSVQYIKRVNRKEGRKEGRKEKVKGSECSASKYIKSVNKCT